MCCCSFPDRQLFGSRSRANDLLLPRRTRPIFQVQRRRSRRQRDNYPITDATESRRLSLFKGLKCKKKKKRKIHKLISLSLDGCSAAKNMEQNSSQDWLNIYRKIQSDPQDGCSPRGDAGKATVSCWKSHKIIPLVPIVPRWSP